MYNRVLTPCMVNELHPDKPRPHIYIYIRYMDIYKNIFTSGGF